MGDLSEWVGFFMSIVVYQKKQNRMILIVKRFSTYPVVNKFPSVSNLHRYLKQKNKPTRNSSRTRELPYHLPHLNPVKLIKPPKKSSTHPQDCPNTTCTSFSTHHLSSQHKKKKRRKLYLLPPTSSYYYHLNKTQATTRFNLPCIQE